MMPFYDGQAAAGGIPACFMLVSAETRGDSTGCSLAIIERHHLQVVEARSLHRLLIRDADRTSVPAPDHRGDDFRLIGRQFRQVAIVQMLIHDTHKFIGRTDRSRASSLTAIARTRKSTGN